MDKRDLRIRRSKVLSFTVENFSQTEIAERLGVSQPTVSRDMVVLDKEAGRMSELVRRSEFRFNTVWNTYLEIDKLVNDAAKMYSEIDASDVKGKISGLQLVMALLSRKIYLLVYMGCDPVDDHRDSLQQYFESIKKEVDALKSQITNLEGNA